MEAVLKMSMGVVKWFNNAKGYGFISLNEDGRDDVDVFAHFSAIEMEGFRTLKRGEPVEFDLDDGPKGLHAINIKAAPGNNTQN